MQADAWRPLGTLLALVLTEADNPGVGRIAAERFRQVDAEGYDKDHDLEEHADGSLAGAAVAYAEVAQRQVSEGYLDAACTSPGEMLPAILTRPPAQSWRWDAASWKPHEDPVRNLEKAGALIAAEIDRILLERAHGG